MKKVAKILTIIFLIISFSMALSACSKKSSEIPYAYISLDIDTFSTLGINPSNNPKVEFVINKRELVIRAIPRNIEAEMILSVLSALEWRDYEDAIEIFIDTATELGFIVIDALRQSPNRIIVTAVGAEDDDTSEVREESIEVVEKYMKKYGIWCDIFVDYMFDNLIPDAKKLNISTARFRMIKSVQMIRQTLKIEDALQLTNKELMIIIKDRAVTANLKELHMATVKIKKAMNSDKYALKGDKEKVKEVNNNWDAYQNESNARLKYAVGNF